MDHYLLWCFLVPVAVVLLTYSIGTGEWVTLIVFVIGVLGGFLVRKVKL